jgi:PKD repeat protein
MRPLFPSQRSDRARPRGQSMVELALLLPVLLLLLLVAIDFGRVFLGWVNLQQMTRIAANHAAKHATAWVAPIDGADLAEQARYRQKVENDARAINCTPPDPIPDPQLASGTTLGAHVRVAFDCEFGLLTPVISAVLGNSILVSAETTYPVKEGIVGTVPGGGSPVVVPPTADFVGSPQSGWGSPPSAPGTAPLSVTFIDQSIGGPTSWTWDFSAGSPSGSGTPSASVTTALTQGPHTVDYDCAGSAGQTCIFNVSLNVSNAGGADSSVKGNYITVTVPPDSGPIAEFTGTPRSGTKPLTVSFQFVDLRGGTVTYTTYEWDLNGDGSTDATGPTAAFNYTTEGSYDVSLRVVDSTGASNTLTKVGYITVVRQICTVPDFANVKVNNAQSRWAAAGFTTQVQFSPGNGNYTIRTQTLVGGTIDPQPDGCGSTITVGP